MAKGRNAKVRLHCEQPACRRCRLISPSRMRQRGRLKHIKGAEAWIRLDGLGEKRDGLVQSSGETAHHPESVEGHEALRIEGAETQSPRRVIFRQRRVAAIRVACAPKKSATAQDGLRSSARLTALDAASKSWATIDNGRLATASAVESSAP